MKNLLAITLILCGSAASAGQMTLKNGDQITGEFKAINGKKVIWNSSTAGELKILKSDIADVKIDKALKINGQSQACYWQGLKGADVALTCNDKAITLPFLTFEELLPFETHAADTHIYNGRFTLAGTQTSGNVESRDWSAALEIDLRNGDFRHGVDAKYSGKFVENKDGDLEEGIAVAPAPVVEYYRADYGLDWFFAVRWYLLSKLSAEKDDATSIDSRYIGALGSGFQWWETPRTALKLEASVLQTKENYALTEDDIADGVDAKRDFASGQIASDYRINFNNDITLRYRMQLSQSFDESKDWNANAELGLGAPLGFGISAEVVAEYLYDNLPALASLEKTDTRLRFGVSYAW
ncbi:MAG: DUF481 domain-containing protein [Marinagarivorans sp.]|nr:DUF481 domain-containing protein [Marinagarivorans sp.]